MSTEAYLMWDGLTPSEDRARRGVITFEMSPWEKGHAGFIHDGNGDTPILILVPEAYDDEQGPTTRIHPHTMAQRLPEALSKAVERHGSGHGREEMLIGFVTRAIELEAQGLNPRVHVSW